MGLPFFDGRKDPTRRRSIKDGKITGFLPYKKSTITFARKMPQEFQVETIEGIMWGKAGDYLAVGIHGEMYPIDAAVFEESYTPVESEPLINPN